MQQQNFKDANPLGVAQEIRDQLTLLLSRSGLPAKLVERCLHDVDGRPHFERVASIDHIKARAPNSSYWGTTCSCACNCSFGVLIPQGKFGKLIDNGNFEFLAPGYHTFSVFGTEYVGETEIAQFNVGVTFGNTGFCTITEGKLGILLCGAEYKILAPGTYFWNSPAVQFERVVDVTTSVAKLGPFTLVTVPSGFVGISYCNGELRILGAENSSSAAVSAVPQQQQQRGGKPSPAAIGAAPGSPDFIDNQIQTARTYFLDDPKWVFHTTLTMKTSTDKLSENDLLSKDNVEILMTAFSHWRIVDPYRAVCDCADDMESIRTKVNSLVRATIARIVAGANVGQTHQTSSVSAAQANIAVGQVLGDNNNNKNNNNDDDLSHLMTSNEALAHMKELSQNLRAMGIEILGVFIPEKRIKNDDIREKIAAQAVIGINAEAMRAAADAKSYSVITEARAQAAAITELARAQADAGQRLGDPSATAARLALTELTAKSFANANVTIFSGSPDQMPFMYTKPMK